MSFSRFWLAIFFQFTLLSSGNPAVVGAHHNMTKKTLHLLALLPFPDDIASPSLEDGPIVLPAVELALEHVNARADILPGYEVSLVVDDGGCDLTNKAYLSLVRSTLNEGPNIIGIVGPRCSASALSVANVIRHGDIALVSVHLGGSELNKAKEENPYSFGILGSTLGLVHRLLDLIKAVGWERLSVLYTPNRIFFHTLYREFIAEMGINATFSVETSIPVSAQEIPLSAIRATMTRVIVVFLDTEFSHQVLCLALRSGMVFPNYQWVWVAQYMTDLNHSVEFEYKGDSFFCSTDDLLSALEGCLVMNFRLTPNDLQKESVSGINYYQFYNEYYSRVSNSASLMGNASASVQLEYETLQPSQYGAVVYDAVWALTLALNKSLENLTDYKIGMPQITDIISNDLLKQYFEGVSGYISFKPDSRFANRAIDIHLLMQQDYTEVDINNITGKVFVDDSFPQQYPEISLLAIGVVVVVVAVEFLLVAATHFTTCFYRKERSIKAVSITLNHFVFVGLYLFFIGISLYLLVKAFTLQSRVAGIICQATWAWILSPGFTLIGGTVTVRMWRIYRIFVHYQNPGKFISNKVLVTMIAILVKIDLAIAVIWTIMDPIVATITSVEVAEADGTIIIEIERTCTSQNTIVWVGLVIGYKITILLSMLTLAILTRKVRDKDFATQNNQVAAYLLVCTIVLGTIFYLLFYITRSQVDIHVDFAVLCLTFVVIVAVCYFSILLPAIVRLMRKKLENEHKQIAPGLINRSLMVVSTLALFHEVTQRKS